MLFTAGPGGLDADHIPFEFDPAGGPLGKLSAHVACANSLWQRCPTGTEVMVTFRGAEPYVSPTWYPSKHESHRQVPAWNYEVVHAHGRITVLDEERFVRALVARLTKRHDAAEPKPWKMGDSAPDFINEMPAKIVGIEIEPTSLTGKSKLSQNKEARDRLSAAKTLATRRHDELAAAMRATVPPDTAKYKTYAAGQACSNCALFGGKAGDAMGPCPLFTGRQVNAKGWCSAYAKKTA